MQVTAQLSASTGQPIRHQPENYFCRPVWKSQHPHSIPIQCVNGTRLTPPSRCRFPPVPEMRLTESLPFRAAGRHIRLVCEVSWQGQLSNQNPKDQLPVKVSYAPNLPKC